MSSLKRSALITLSALALCSCVVQTGNGRLATEQRTVPAFSKVSIHNGITANIVHGSPSLALTTDENLLVLLETQVLGDTLIVRVREGFTINPASRIRADVSNEVLVGLEATGGSHVSADATVANEWRLSLSGGSTVGLSRLEAEQLVLEASGGSHADVFGIANSVIVTGSGGSQLDCDGVSAVDATVELSGGSSLHVRASRSVQGSASGGSVVTVSGNPTTQAIATSGGSKVIWANE